MPLVETESGAARRRLRPRGWARRLRVPSWPPRWAELGPLAGIAAVAASLLAFAQLADEVLEGETHAFDEAILLWLRSAADLSDPVGPLWFEKMARDVTSLGSVTVLFMVSLAVAGFLAMVRKRGAALLVLASVGGGAALSSTLKLVFERDRPDLVPHAVDVYTASFPSGHAMLTAVTYLTLGALLLRVSGRRRVKAYVMGVAATLTVLVGASRVYLGVHWPTDVLAGWCIGSGWAGLCWLVAAWLQREGQVEEADGVPPATADDPREGT
jgi:undecaprenyl-diphosphatase